MRGKHKQIMESPCRDLCGIDPVSHLCTGCFRTREEIARWTRYSVSQRQAVLAALAKRARAAASKA